MRQQLLPVVRLAQFAPRRRAKVKRENRRLPNPRHLLLLCIAAMSCLAGVAVAAILYAVYSIDVTAIAAETARANVAVSLTVTADTAFDGDLAERIAHDFSLSNAHFAASGALAANEASVVLPGTDGTVLVWEPRRFGTELFFQLAPLRLLACALLLGGIGIVLHRLYALAGELEVRRQAAQDLAARDALTGLSNRLAFDERLEQAYADRRGDVALLYLDLDGFKNVNDTMGHGAGDQVLRTVAARLKGFAQDGDLVARLGGDEFGLLVTSRTGEAGLSELAADIRIALSEPQQIGKNALLVGVSIGIAMASRDASSPLELVRAADEALYRAKATSGGGYVFADMPGSRRAL